MCLCDYCIHRCVCRYEVPNDTPCEDYINYNNVVNVRCGECKWWKDSRCTNVNGAYDNIIFNPDWFCRSGMRKD